MLEGIACSVSVSLPVSCFLAWADSLGPWRSLHCRSWRSSHTVTENSSWCQMVCSSIRRTASVTLTFHLHSSQGLLPCVGKNALGEHLSLPPRFLSFCLYHKSQTNVHFNKTTKKELSHVSKPRSVLCKLNLSHV